MRLAVTGGIAEGKSTVLQAIREAGYETVSADDIARDVFRSAKVQAGLSRILGKDEPIHPETLKTALFERPEVRREVNRLMHAPILGMLIDHPAPVVEVPLLIESCLQGLFDGVWVVTCGPEEQLRRLSLRLGDPQLASRMIQAQLNSRIKLPFADRIVRTNLEMDTVRQYVFEAIRRDLELRLARS